MAVVFFLENYKILIDELNPLPPRSNCAQTAAGASVITGGVGEDTQLISYYSRRRTKSSYPLGFIDPIESIEYEKTCC